MADWETFVTMVRGDPNLGKGKYFKLTDNITINLTYTSPTDEGQRTAHQKSIVSDFRGTLDGGGNTLTLNFTQEVGNFSIAPFDEINGATIKHLKVAGSISTNKTRAGGIASWAIGENNIEDCAVSVTISTYMTGPVYHGGFVGRNEDTLNFKNCVFSGSLKGTTVSGDGYYTSRCGGFVGQNAGTANFNNCLVDVESENITVTNSRTFTGYDDEDEGGSSTFTNAYYTHPIGAAQGTQVFSESTAPAGKFCEVVFTSDGKKYGLPRDTKITGLSGAYGSPANVSYGVNINFYTPLEEDTDYDAYINDQKVGNPTSIAAEGNYTLTVTGNGKYFGSLSKSFKVIANTGVIYIDENGDGQSVSAAALDNTFTELEGWYCVTGTEPVNVDHDLTVKGTVNLILCDGAELKVKKGHSIFVTTSNTLNIYCQAEGTGKLTVVEGYAAGAGIGGKSGQGPGTINIYGGVIEATGGSNAAGIGGGITKDGGAVNIYGGTVTATGRVGAAGIGGGGNTPDAICGGAGTIKIYGGNVTAKAQHADNTMTGPGIGAGQNGSGGTVELGWTNPTDSIEANSYGGTSVTVTFADGKKFMLKGTNTLATSGNIGGNTIVPAYSVTFEAGGGTGTMDAQAGAVGGDYALPNCTFTAPNGKRFAGWKIGTGETLYSAGSTVTLNGDITATAQWEKTPATAPSITATTPEDLSLTVGYSSGSKLTVTATAQSGHTLSSYQWYSIEADGSATAIPDATTYSYTFPTNKGAGTYYYYCVVTSKRTDNGDTATSESRVATVTVVEADNPGGGTSGGGGEGGTGGTGNESGNGGGNNSGNGSGTGQGGGNETGGGSGTSGGSNTGKTDPVTPDNGKTDDNGSNSGVNGGGDDNGNGNDNGDTQDDKPDTEPEKTEEQKATEKQAEELVSNMDKTVANSDAGQSITDALKSEDPDKQAAAVDVVEKLNDSLKPEEIAQLKPEEITSAVENKKNETADAKKEEDNGGKVEDTKTPAGTDLLDKSNTVSEELKKANENLSVKPKFVEPKPLSENDVKKIEDKLSGLIAPDKKIMSAGNINVKTTEEDKDLSKQAERLENLFKLVAKALANVINTALGKSASVTLASTASERGLVIATVLPEITVEADGYYPMEVNLRNVTPGRVLSFWPSAEYLNQYVNGEVEEYDAYFLDENNEVVTKVSGNAAKMKVVPYLEKGKTYGTAFITVVATAEDLAALETLAAETNTGDENDDASGPSGGGCDSGFGALALAGLIPLFRKKQK